MKKIASLTLLAFMLVVINPVVAPVGFCGDVDLSGKRMTHQQQMAEHDKKIADLEERAKKIRQEREEGKNRKEVHRLAGIMLPPLGYIFWLFRYCP